MRNIFIALVFLVSSLSFAEPQQPQDVTVSTQRPLAKWNPATGKFVYEKGAEPEELAEVLMKELSVLAARYQALQNQCAPAQKASKKAPAKDSHKEKAP